MTQRLCHPPTSPYRTAIVTQTIIDRPNGKSTLTRFFNLCVRKTNDPSSCHVLEGAFNDQICCVKSCPDFSELAASHGLFKRHTALNE
uniref:Uncharacterized protein n=1 Tax=Physcomitrium patens TaxID=3218 RepID=A0A2K1KVZ0_PHYPA|nr:hypothetical protein PHYPA_004937 [Physcomitrium patens]